MKRHFSMLRDFHLADWFTLANAFCGTGAIFAAMRFLQEGGASESGVRHLLIGMALIPLAFVFERGGDSIIAPAILHTSSNAPAVVLAMAEDIAAVALVPHMGVVLLSLYLVFAFRHVSVAGITSASGGHDGRR